jgi:hypothetical protein
VSGDRPGWSDASKRAVLIFVVLAAVIGVAVADAGHPSAAGGSAPRPVSTQSVESGTSASGTAVGSTSAQSSAWFCVGGTARGGNAASTLIFTNPTGRPVVGTATTVTVGSNPIANPVAVAPHSQTGVLEDSATTGVAVATTVVIHGGGVGLTQMVSGPLGPSPAPCASRTSSQWYFPHGSTASGSSLSLSLYNPTQSIAVVNVSFVAATGVVAPPAYQGVEVAGGSLVVENVGDHLIDNPDIATVVTTLSGEVVAAELQSSGKKGDGGASVVLGAAAPSSLWTFPVSRDVPQGSTVFHLFNPSAGSVRVTVTFGLEQGRAEPLMVRVPANSTVALDADQVTRLPADTDFSAVFDTGSTGGVVVSRQVSSPPVSAPSPSTASAPQMGDTMGTPGGASRWLIPAVASPATGISVLSVVDLARNPVTVRFVAEGPTGPVAVTSLGTPRLLPGLPEMFTPVSPVGSVPLEVFSGGPVAVEAEPAPVGSTGVAVIPALPLS